jgi:hypothetical protein
MWGFLIGLAIVGFSMVFGGATISAAFLKAANFLFIWYLVFAVIRVFIMIIVNLGVLGTSVLLALFSKFKLLAGGMAVATGGATLVATMFMLLSSAMSVGGAYMLKISGTPEIPMSQFNLPYLIVGGLLIFFSVIWGSRRNRVVSVNTRRYR